MAKGRQSKDSGHGLLPSADRESIMKELFLPNYGANFTICRMPIGANDFSRDWYSYNENDGDFKMKNFSIQNDTETLIPFIKSAQLQNADIKVWASPWCPPSWMKHNKHYASAVCDPSLKNTKFDNGPCGKGRNGYVYSEARISESIRAVFLEVY